MRRGFFLVNAIYICLIWGLIDTYSLAAAAIAQTSNSPAGVSDSCESISGIQRGIPKLGEFEINRGRLKPFNLI